MNVLQEEREGLQTLLEEVLGVNTFDHVPERFQGPTAFALPGAPYIEQGEKFNEHEANFAIHLVAGTGSNAVVTNWLDNALSSVIPALIEAGWFVQGVDEPFMYQVANANYLSVIVRVSTDIRFVPNN